MHLAAAQLLKAFHGELAGGIGGGADAERDERLLQVKAHGPLVKDVLLEARDRLGNVRRDKVDAVGNLGELLDGIEHYGRGGVHERRILAGNDPAVLKLQRSAAENARINGKMRFPAFRYRGKARRSASSVLTNPAAIMS